MRIILPKHLCSFKNLSLLAIFLLIFSDSLFGQCPPKITIYSPYPAPGTTYAAASSNLKDVFNVIPGSSLSLNYTHTFTFSPLSDFTIKFGDGSPDFNYQGSPITSTQHTYTTQGLFIYEVIDNLCPTAFGSVKGRIYTGKDVEPSILGAGFPPTDSYCLPNSLSFQNNSLGISPFFEFDWDFGDTPSTPYDTTLTITNGIGLISHRYSKANQSCGVYVKFRVRKILPNSTFTPFQQTGGPYNFITVDIPKVNNNEVILCERNNTTQDVELSDISSLNCASSLPRTIKWQIVNQPVGKPLSIVSGTFGSPNNYYTTANKKVKVRVPSTAVNGDIYTIKMVISNTCGSDTTYSNIRIVRVVTPTFTLNNTPICPGRKLTFQNTSPERTLSYYDFYWDVYNESGIKISTLQSKNEFVDISFALPGKYKVMLRGRVNPYSLTTPIMFCEAISEFKPQIEVWKSIVAKIDLPKDTFCIKGSGTSNENPVIVTLNNSSLNETVSAQFKWYISKVGSDTSTISKVPFSNSRTASISLNTHGRYIFKLEAFDPSSNCTKTFALDTVFIFPQPNIFVTANNACFGESVILRDSSKVIYSPANGLPSSFEFIKTIIDFGDGTGTQTYTRNNPGTCGLGENLFTSFNFACTRLTSHTYSKPGEYWIKVKVITSGPPKNYCSLTDSVLAKVFSLPTASFIKSEDGCIPLNVKFKNTTISSNVSQYIWNINGTDIATKINSTELDTVFTNEGSNKIILKALSNNNCLVSSSPQFVVAFPVPEFEISSDYSTFSSKCSPLKLQFKTILGSTPIEAIDSVFWSFYDGTTKIGEAFNSNSNLNTSFTFINSSFVQKKIRVTLSVKLKLGGCIKSKDIEFIIDPKPKVSFHSEKTTGCSPLSIQFSLSEIDINRFTQYSWSFPGGSQLTSDIPNPPVITFVNIGKDPIVTKVRLTTTSLYGCSDYSEQTITVYPQSVPKFNIDGNHRLCSGESLRFENKSEGSVIAKYVWLWGDGTPNDTTLTQTGSIWHKFNNNSTVSDSIYRVKITGLAECPIESEIKIVTVERKLKTDFNIISSGSCSPFLVTFSSQSEGPISSLTWKVNGEKLSKKTNTVSLSLSNKTSLPVSYKITLITQSQNGCVDSLSKNIIINPEIITAFESKNTKATSCSPVQFKFTNKSEGPAIAYLWDYGDGMRDTVVTKDTILHLFQNPSIKQITYRVTLTAITKDSCFYSKFADILISPSSTADFAMDSVGCSPFEISFKNKSLKTDILEWTFDNGKVYSGTNPPNQIYINTGSTPITKNIKLRALSTGGCEDIIIKQVRIFPEPKPSFKVTPEVQIIPNSTITIENTSNAGDWKYEWEFGDGIKCHEKNPPQHNYETFGVYKVSLTLSNPYCSKTSSVTIKVLPREPIADFTSEVIKGCRPLTVKFKNNSKYADSLRYKWDFGDGAGKALSVNPTYTFYNPGKYSVKLIAENIEGKSNTIIKENFIEVIDLPQAAFQFKPALVHVPKDPVYFTNLSFSGDSYFWDFGDGNTSTEKDPGHVYRDTGTFTITLVVINKEECSDTLVIERAIKATSEGDIKIPNAFSPSLIGSSSRNISSEGINDLFIPIFEGEVIDMEMKVFNRWGQMMFFCRGISCKGWDGSYQGKLCPQDVYVYSIKVKLQNGEVIEKVGDVMLLR